MVCDKDKLFNEAYVLFCLAVLLDIVLLVIIYKLNKVCVIPQLDWGISNSRNSSFFGGAGVFLA